MGRKNKRSNNTQTTKETNQVEVDKKPLTTTNGLNVEVVNSTQSQITTNNRNETQNEIKTNTTDVLLSELKFIRINSNLKTPSQKKPEKLHRDFYINYLCQVCKEFNNDNEICTKCRMISYCSKEHRREHWPIHAELCAALQEICESKNRVHVLENTTTNQNADTFRAHCYNLMLTCENILQRKLDDWEVEFVLFPRVCHTCYNHRVTELKRCDECRHCNYCKTTPEHLPSNHKQYCNSLKLHRKMLQYQYKNGVIETIFPDTSSLQATSFKNSTSINDILKQSKNNLNDLEYTQLTEIASSPLTVAYCLTLNEKISKTVTETFTIHVIGAEKDFELNQLQKWEIFFLHVFNTIKTLNIIFIGPEMKITNEDAAELNNITLCDNCSNKFRRINCEFYDKTLYHDYLLNRKRYIKPNFICAFNAGLYRTTGFNERDSWPDTIKAMFKTKGTPVLITAYTSVEIMKDIKRIKDIHKCEIIKMPNQNPFSSLKPNLNFVSYEDSPVIFKNYYLVLLKN